MKGDNGNRATIPPVHPCIFLHLAATTKRVEIVSAQARCVPALFP